MMPSQLYLEARARELYIQGYTIVKISKILGVSQYRINQWSKIWKIDRYKRLYFPTGRPITILDENNLRRLVSEGHSNTSICKILKVHHKTLKKNLVKYNIPTRRHLNKFFGKLQYTCPICDCPVEANSKQCSHCNVGFHEPHLIVTDYGN